MRHNVFLFANHSTKLSHHDMLLPNYLFCCILYFAFQLILCLRCWYDDSLLGDHLAHLWATAHSIPRCEVLGTP